MMNKKMKQIVVGVIAALLVLTMVITGILPYIM